MNAIAKQLTQLREISLRQRIRFSFLVAISFIVTIGAFAFYLLDEVMREAQILLALAEKYDPNHPLVVQIHLLSVAEHQAKFILMIVMLLTMIGGLLVGWIAPRYTVFPLRRFARAIRTARANEFATRISFKGEREFNEIAQELNAFLKDMEVFEKLRTEKLYLAKETIEALANLITDPVLTVDAQTREIIYMNHEAYRVFDLTSDLCIGRTIERSRLPESVIQALQRSIEREEKAHQDLVLPIRKGEEGEEKEEQHFHLDTSLIWDKERKNVRRVVLIMHPIPESPIPMPVESLPASPEASLPEPVPSPPAPSDPGPEPE